MIGSIANTGLQGLLDGQQKLKMQANKIASPSSDQQDITRSLVEMKQAKQQIEANVQTIRTGNEVIGTLLDITA